MPLKPETRDLETAHRHVDDVQRRCARQRARVARQTSENRRSPRAQALLATLEKREARARKYLEAIQGWHRKHPFARVSKTVKKRLLNRRFRDGKIPGKATEWDKAVRTALDKQFAEAPNHKSYLLGLWDKYLTLGLPNGHFVSEICSGKAETVAQRAWEMMLVAHFDALGFTMTSPNDGPDLRFEHDGRVHWVEAICPTPAGIPEDWIQPLDADDFIVGDVPHNETLLRWTTAIKEKRAKLTEYQKKGIVGAEDSYVIAVNGGQLGRMPLNNGVSQMPYAVEAVYPAGPLIVEINKESGKVVRVFRSIRTFIEKVDGKKIPVTAFLDIDNAGVSAIFGYSSDRSNAPILTADVVHNHLAERPVDRGLLGPDNAEWGKVRQSKGAIEVGKLPARASERSGRSI